MQPLQTTLNTIATHLRGLSSTAKMLLGALMVILMLTLFLVAQYAGKSSMEPLGLRAGMGTDAMGQAIAYLQSRNIPHRPEGSDILVPPDQRYGIIAELTDGEIITPDQINFDTLIAQDSPFLSRRQNDQRWIVATQNVLSRTISRMSGIARAVVIIHERDGGMGLGRAHVPASASVTVWTRGGPMSQSKVDAIAQMVAGSHANLPLDRVSIIDNTTGTAYRARTDEARAAAETLEFQRETERNIHQKLSDLLSYIPGVSVAVRVTVDTKQIVEERRDFDEPRIGVTSESSRAINSTQQLAGGEAGVRPNTGASITGGSGRRSSSMSDERTSSSMIPVFGNRTSRIHEQRAHALQINATIAVPRSYFVRLLSEQQGDTDVEVDPAQLDALVANESARIQAQIEPLIDTRAVDGAVSGAVVVSMVPDFALPHVIGASSVHEAGGGESIFNVASEGLVKHIGLAALALLSLAMMFLMVRKATVRQPLPTADELIGIPPTLSESDSDLIGEAAESVSSLEGVELDDESIRRQQMLDQINEMAKTSPQDAVSLIRRWIKAPS